MKARKAFHFLKKLSHFSIHRGISDKSLMKRLLKNFANTHTHTPQLKLRRKKKSFINSFPDLCFSFIHSFQPTQKDFRKEPQKAFKFPPLDDFKLLLLLLRISNCVAVLNLNIYRLDDNKYLKQCSGVALLCCHAVQMAWKLSAFPHHNGKAGTLFITTRFI